MTKLESFVSEQIKTLVPNFDAVDLNATVNSTSFSVEFFATVGGKRMQCFEMMEDGMFTEKNFNKVSRAIANYLRELPDFNAEGINEYTVNLK